MSLIILIPVLILLFWFRYKLVKKNRFPNAELIISQLEKLCD